MRAPRYAFLDEAIETLAPYGIELENGNSNHAPMVAEAPCAMSRPDAVMPWIARYRERMLPRFPARGRIHRDDWRAALGQRDRFAERRNDPARGDTLCLAVGMRALCLLRRRHGDGREHHAA